MKIDFFEFNTIENQKVAFFYSKKRQLVSFVFNTVYLLDTGEVLFTNSDGKIIMKETELIIESNCLHISLDMQNNAYRAMRLLTETDIGKYFKCQK